MSQAPYSKPDVNDVVNSSHVFKIRSSLNHWSGGRLPNARGKHLFGLVVIALLLLGLQLTACGNAAPSTISSASPTSNSTSQSNTPSTTSAPDSTPASTAGPTTGPTTDPTTGPTTEPTTGPTTGPTVVPTADPSSFTVTEAGITYAFKGSAGQQATIDPDNSEFSSPYIDVTYGDPSSSTPAGPIDWSVSANQNWIGLDPSGGSLKFGSPLRVNIKVSIPQEMKAGTYTGKIVFSPNTSGNNHDDVKLTVVPYVSKVNPTSGPAAGGTSVIITGSGFTGATGVSFGGAEASNFTVDSDTQITATSPAGSGTVDVTVTTPNGTSATGAADQFTYISAPSGPTVSGISPTGGSAAGGTTVTITGSGFTSATSVSFGSTAASGFTVNSDTQITATSPAGSGTVDVTVTTPNGTSATGAADQFTYT